MAFGCPECHAPLPQLPCSRGWGGYEAADAAGSRSPQRSPAVQEAISAARSTGRAAWYEAPHADQWAGPSRHHLAKRRDYLDATLSRLRGPVTALAGWPSTLAAATGSISDCWRLGRGSRRHRLQPAAPDQGGATGARRGAACRGRDQPPGADESVDLIFFDHVIEHIDDDAGALREVRRLRPAGICILGTPNEGVRSRAWRIDFSQGCVP